MVTPFVPVPNTVQVELVQNNDFQIVENVIHYKGSAPYSLADMTNLAAQLITYWNTYLKPLTSINSNLVNIILTGMDTESSPRTIVTPAGPPQGSATGIGAPNNVTIAFKKDTGLRGRSNRGRLYACALPISAVTGDQMTATARSAWLSALNQVTFLGPTTNGSIMSVVSKRHNNAWRTTGVATPVLSFAAVDGNLDSQRRRLTGRGR